VGINDYQDPTFRPLQYAETDAKAFAQWLLDPRGGMWNPAEVNVTVGQEATKERLEAQFMQLCVHAAAPGDLIFIYFAGHAFIDEASGEAYLTHTLINGQVAIRMAIGSVLTERRHVDAAWKALTAQLG